MRKFLLIPMILIMSIMLTSCINLSALFGESTYESEGDKIEKLSQAATILYLKQA